MKEMMKNKPCFFILVVVAILSFITGVVVGHAVFLLGDAEFVVSYGFNPCYAGSVSY